MNRCKYLLGWALIWISSSPVQAYVDVSPTLGWLVKDADSIAVLQIDKINFEKRMIIFKKVADLKGTFPHDIAKHHLVGGFHPRTENRSRVGRAWQDSYRLHQGQRGHRVHRALLVPVQRIGRQLVDHDDRQARTVAGVLWPSRSIARSPDGYACREGSSYPGRQSRRMGVWQYNNVAFQKVLRGKDCPVWASRPVWKCPAAFGRLATRIRLGSWVRAAVGTEDIRNLYALCSTRPRKIAFARTPPSTWG